MSQGLIAMTPAWQAALRWALAHGIAPTAFWQLSLSEWRALTAAPEGAPMTRDTLTALQAKYPDNAS